MGSMQKLPGIRVFVTAGELQSSPTFDWKHKHQKLLFAYILHVPSNDVWNRDFAKCHHIRLDERASEACFLGNESMCLVFSPFSSYPIDLLWVNAANVQLFLGI